jgi:hypothetical protein
MSELYKPRKYRKFLGPSQFAIVLDLDEYQSKETLRDEIENGYIPKDTYATQFGNDNESVALYYYQKLHKVNIEKAKFVVDPNNSKIGGICDGLLDSETGLEIKCHVKDDNLLTQIPIKYLIQIAGYMYLYKRKKWVLVSNIFNPDKTLKKYSTFEVTWDEVKDRWNQEWYPNILQFAKDVKWVHT